MIQAPNSAASSSAPASSGSGGSGISQATSDEMGKEAFLKLLVTQLGNQDPMNPMKGQEFAAQLAQFSSVEQLTNISEQVGNQQAGQQALVQSLNSGVAAGLIGRSVETGSNEMAWDGEGERTMGVELNAPAAKVTVEVRNEAGSVVSTRTLENVPKGSEEITWDGTNDDGSTLAEGTYTFEVSATDAAGDAVTASTYTSGTVDRVTFGQDGTTLWVDGAKVPMGQVRSVAAATE